MKNLMFFALLLSFLFVFPSCEVEEIPNDKDVYEEWDDSEYQEMLITHFKIYVYPDGNYVVTKEVIEDSKNVALLYLANDLKIDLKDKKGKLPDSEIKQLSDIELFNPSKVFAEPPCCPIRDKYGKVLYHAYSPKGCDRCRKWTTIRGKTYIFNCCPVTQLVHDSVLRPVISQ